MSTSVCQLMSKYQPTHEIKQPPQHLCRPRSYKYRPMGLVHIKERKRKHASPWPCDKSSRHADKPAQHEDKSRLCFFQNLLIQKLLAMNIERVHYDFLSFLPQQYEFLLPQFFTKAVNSELFGDEY